MKTATSEETRKPLAYHLASERYGTGVCGTPGMMAVGLDNVTCKRCRSSTIFIASKNLQQRIQGARP